MKRLIVAFALLASSALAQQQQPDPLKLSSAYRQQRDMANDTIAALAVQIGELQAEVQRLRAELAARQEKPKDQ